MTETLLLAVILIPCLIIAIVFHEVAHGWTALALGDPTAKEQKRLSLNPIRHVDPIGTLLVPGALALFGGPIFGWAKPVPVRGDRLRDPRFGMVAVAAAGPGTNLLLAFVGALLFGTISGAIIASGGVPPEWLLTAGGMFILINVFLALFNLLPIYPMDGGHIVYRVLHGTVSSPEKVTAVLSWIAIAAILVGLSSRGFSIQWAAIILGLMAFENWQIFRGSR